MSLTKSKCWHSNNCWQFESFSLCYHFCLSDNYSNKSNISNKPLDANTWPSVLTLIAQPTYHTSVVKYASGFKLYRVWNLIHVWDQMDNTLKSINKQIKLYLRTNSSAVTSALSSFPSKKFAQTFIWAKKKLKFHTGHFYFGGNYSLNKD